MENTIRIVSACADGISRRARSWMAISAMDGWLYLLCLAVYIVGWMAVSAMSGCIYIYIYEYAKERFR